MSVVHRFRALFSLVVHRKAMEAELDEEVQSFYETKVQRHIEKGVAPSEARRLARLEFLSPELIKEQVRDVRTGVLLLSIARDIKYSFRRLRKSPAFAIVIMLTLALGIAANSTIFSIVSRFVLRLPPVGDPNMLLALHTSHQSECCNNFSWPLFDDLRQSIEVIFGPRWVLRTRTRLDKWKWRSATRLGTSRHGEFL